MTLFKALFESDNVDDTASHAVSLPSGDTASSTDDKTSLKLGIQLVLTGAMPESMDSLHALLNVSADLNSWDELSMQRDKFYTTVKFFRIIFNICQVVNEIRNS